MRVIVLLLGLALSSLHAVVTEVASLRGFLYGSEANCAYDNWVSHLAEGRASTLNVYAPWETQNNSFGDYLVPDSLMLAKWDSAVEDFLALRLVEAQQKLRRFGFPYEVVSFQDIDSGRHLYLLRELPNDDYDDNGTPDPADDEAGSFSNGWGLYVFDPAASRPILITAPHPCDDYPSPAFALEAFHALDARFLLINGAGREVAYTGNYYYSNNQSISDPSRYEAHPFNCAYRRCADQIRGLTDRMEFSLQIHSYDWNKYNSETDLMFSAGHSRQYCALPLRDNSRSRHDLIHALPRHVHPAGAVGNNSAVDFSDYCSVYYLDEFVYHADGYVLEVPYQNELPGSFYNQQMAYTLPQNLYDVYSPFLHVEMDELPGCYEQASSYWRWFYGYDADTQTWDPGQRYTRFIQFYTPWLNALVSVIDDMLQLDDGTGPSDPENLTVTASGGNWVYLAWDRSYSYDFDSYLLEYRYEEDGQLHYVLLDRNSDPSLAWQAQSSIQLNVGSASRLYYFRLRARDKHGNYSNFSNEIKLWRMGTVAGSFLASSGEAAVDVTATSYLAGIQGMNIYRRAGSGTWNRIAGWAQFPSLAYDGSNQYGYTDQHVLPGVVYEYQISAELPGGEELFHWQTARASPYFRLPLRLSSTNYPAADSLILGISPLASDGEDGFDLDWNGGGAVSLAGQVGEDTLLRQDVKAAFDPSAGCKAWNLGYRAQLEGLQLRLQASPQLLQQLGNLIVHDPGHGLWHDLRAGDYIWPSADNLWHTLILYWGYQLPFAVFNDAPQGFVPAGQELALGWSVVNPSRVASVNLCCVADGDTLLLAGGLSPQVSSFLWTPDQASHNARIQAELLCLDGSRLYFPSENEFCVVPARMSYQGQAGQSLVSFPLSGFSEGVGSLFGAGVQAWGYAQGNWAPASQLEGGNLYLIDSPQPWSLTLPAELPSGVAFFDLVPGWNLLPNPHWRRYEIRDLLFDTHASVKGYAQMAAEGALAARILVRDAAGWKLGSQLLPQQGFALYYAGSAPCSVVFDPGYREGEEVAFPTAWQLCLSVSDGFSTGDAVVLGSSPECGDGMDPLFDLPKPPAFPNQPRRISLLEPEGGFQSGFKGLYPWYTPTQKTWQFKLEAAGAGPIRISLEDSSLPPDYSVLLDLNGDVTELTPQISYWFAPPAPGLYYGSVSIRNYPSSTRLEPSLHPVAEPRLGAWPNPFRGQVSVRASLAKGGQAGLCVYNLRGQKVADLYQGPAETGKLDLVWNGLGSNGKALPAGIYFLRLATGAGTVTHKLVKL
jgi:hypothetical protein